MGVIAWKLVREFIASGHADASGPLREWFRAAELAEQTKLVNELKIRGHLKVPTK